jgi:hypothetical protein
MRLASGLLLLPLLVKKLPTNDLGMYYIFLSLAAIANLVDFGFANTIGRAIAYALGGARELKMQGVAPAEQSAAAQPNYPLVWHLLHVTRVLFRYLTILACLLVGSIGTYVVWMHAAKTASPTVTWLAWTATLVAAVWEIYAGWWSYVLGAMNQVVLGNRLAVLAYATRLLLASVLLLAGAGLVSVPLASFVSTLLQRALTRRACMRLLDQTPRPETPVNVRGLLATIWPNTWRQGMAVLGRYLSDSMNPLICLGLFGLAANAQYGLSVQIIALCQGIAAAWWNVKMPLVLQFRARHDLAAIRQTVAPRIWLQAITFVLLAGVAVLFGQHILQWMGSNKLLLPPGWMALLALNAFLDVHFMFWTALIGTENRAPYVWPAVITNICSLLTVILLARFTSLGLGSLILGPLLTGCAFNYWYWAHAGARGLQTSWFRLRFSRPH